MSDQNVLDHPTGEEVAKEATPSNETNKVRWKVTGLDCPNCAQGVERSVCALKGVKCASLVYASSTLDVEIDEGADEVATRKAILKAVRKAGHDVEGSLDPEDDRSALTRNLPAISLAASGVFVVSALLLDKLAGLALPADVLYILAVLAGLIIMLPRALSALKNKSIDMNILMMIAVLGAVALGELGEAALVIFLFALGNRLEARSMQKTRDSIRSLMDLAPQTATVKRDGALVALPVEEVAIGEVMTIKPGERVPLDGIVMSGSASVDESPLTGEPIPVLKGTADEVFAGSLSVNGALVVEVRSAVEDSTLARIVELVEEAQTHKAPYESFVDRFSAKYTPIVVGTAIAIAVIPPLISLLTPWAFGGFSEWVNRALVLLVVSCPCALVISTPVSIVSAISRAAREGILVKGGAFLELGAKVTALAYDKTGTLTYGKPQVSTVVQLGDEDIADIVSNAAALEAKSTHPLGTAIVALAHEKRTTAEGTVELEEPSELVETSGKGLEGIVAGKHVLVGSPSFAESHLKDTTGGLDPATIIEIEDLETKGNTVLVVVVAGEPSGLIAVRDQIRDTAHEMVERLRAQGVSRQIMLTGDNERAAATIAAKVGVDEHRAHLLPSDKSAFIETISSEGDIVAMVGDGINDAPALAAADVGIAMGGAGSDTAIETADVVLMADDLSGLPKFFSLGRKTMSIVRQNVVVSLMVKVLVFILAIAGIANLWMAVFADTGVALLVILNGMRLLNKKTARI